MRGVVMREKDEGGGERCDEGGEEGMREVLW